MPEIVERLAAELDVVVLGELNPDVLVHGVDPFVRFGQVESQVSGASLRLGSSGAITAAAGRAMGLLTALCAVVGDDPVGRLTTGLLAETGVEPAVQVRADLSTGMTIVLNTDGGDRALLTHLGAMAALTCDDVPAELLGRARHVHISSIFLQQGLHAGLPAFLDGLRARGVTTSLDPGWDPAEDWSIARSLLPHLDLLLPNEQELRGIARTSLLLDDDLLLVAQALASLGPAVVVKRGAQGAVHVTSEATWTLTGEAVTPVDTTGAGDNFDAGLLWARSRGLGPAGQLAAATAAGTVAVGGIGGTGLVATSEQLTAAVERRSGDARRLR